MRVLALPARTLAAAPAGEQTVSRIARGVVLVLIALVYSGVAPFLYLVSPLLFYALDVGLLAALVVSLRNEANGDLRSILPYLAWLMFYFLWGTMVSPDKALVFSDAIRSCVRGALLLSAVTLGLGNRRHLGLLAQLVQVGAVVNFLFALRGAVDPAFVTQLANALNPVNAAFSELRPAGLWINANEAAFAYIFALLLSPWAPRPLAWAGRIAALAGIYLTASRSGLALLTICAAVYLLFKLRSLHFHSGHLAALAGGLLAVILLALALLNSDVLVQARDVDLVANSNLGRMLDFSESASQNAGIPTRTDVAALAAQRALDGPWSGYGVFSFEGVIGEQGVDLTDDIGAHDIYLVVLGETGIVSLAGYLVVLALAVVAILRARVAPGERAVLIALGACYLVIGFVWHNQLTSEAGALYTALLFCLPALLAARAPGPRPLPGEARA